ncbi:hypothetical protein P6P37_05955 [Clostridium perfringens]|uniref:hypothetical protein n=2 Tax=Clostridium perfringens TaxID=1502 RepID=UPI001C84AF02|nr:hypothetical protein [Clostridium perfringens]EGT0683780.1 hypothetical protein [Clostridium perfringens]EGT0686810.1 hypothetical protein [Clostridium perfringens]ELC8309359.1 hypothetical protein [Clostridium perfringens]ELC8392252.1 hypothetical protein [Clostridium perfringens]ELC8409894.1 hypothetical protein [Clostridium perfringens]
MSDSMFTKSEKEKLSKMIGIDDLLDIEIATIMINKFPNNTEELFYENYDKMIETYGIELCEIFRKCLDIIWFEARV